MGKVEERGGRGEGGKCEEVGREVGKEREVDDDRQRKGGRQIKDKKRRTEAPPRIAPTLAALPHPGVLGTVRVRVVLVPDLLEEMDLVPRSEDPRGDAVHGRVAPALKGKSVSKRRKR
jgi:hypothetical protein